MTRAYREAVGAGKTILREAWRDSYAKTERGVGITELRCSGCGVVIARLLPVGPGEVHRHKDRTIVQEYVALTKIANYREVMWEMNDGSRHVTNMCVDCAGHSADPMFAVALYASDLAQWSSEGGRLSDEMCNRSPVRVIKIADAIRE